MKMEVGGKKAIQKVSLGNSLCRPKKGGIQYRMERKGSRKATKKNDERKRDRGSRTGWNS